jgi:hypothetical protein
VITAVLAIEARFPDVRQHVVDGSRRQRKLDENGALTAAFLGSNDVIDGVSFEKLQPIV